LGKLLGVEKKVGGGPSEDQIGGGKSLGGISSGIARGKGNRKNIERLSEASPVYLLGGEGSLERN